MKITKVESFAVQKAQSDQEAYWGRRAWGDGKARRGGEISTEYPARQRRKFAYSKTIDTVIVKLTTDEGLIGYGESKAPVAPSVAKHIIDEILADLVLQSNPRETTVLWEKMYAAMRVRGHHAGFYLEAISGIDIALWDLVGKSTGLPIYQLLGGAFRNPVRVYASGLPALDIGAPAEAFRKLADDADTIRQQGFGALKMAVGKGLAGDLRSIREVKERLGEEFIVYADAAGAYDRVQALQLGKELEDLGVGWFEMPIFPEDLEGYAELAKALTIPIALDSLSSRHEVLAFLRRGALDVVQPDVCRAGGMTECRRIAELADAFGVAFAPHVSIGSAIHFAASAHLAAAMPNTIISEYWIGQNPLGDAIADPPLNLENGYLYAPGGAGLGIKIKEDILFSTAAGGED